MSRWARLSACCLQPARRSWASRQARITAADTSMAESSPKPIKLIEPAAMPAAIATTPSTTFQPTVAPVSHFCRVTAASRVVGVVSAIGQHS